MEGQKLDLDLMEDLIGIKYEDCEEGKILVPERWQLINKVDSEGKTCLMRAAVNGNVPCMDLILRCGANVNARDNEGRRAIDLALDGDQENRPEVILFLLQRDSLLPDLTASRSRKRFEAFVHQNEGIRQFFAEREKIHEMAKRNEVESIEDALGESESSFGCPRYWVNAEGHSVLYAAAYELSYDSWALLKSRHFEYVGAQEDVLASKEKYNRTELDQALDKYFSIVPECHVLKMVLRSKVLGCPGGTSRTSLDVYERVDKVPMASHLLKCLQDQPRFEVVFDMERSEAHCPIVGSPEGGVSGPGNERQYIPSGVTDEFQSSDMINNLVHELAHRAMSVVFANDGLPYKKDDAMNMNKYDEAVSTFLSDRRIRKFDKDIRKVKEYPEKLHGRELIVKIPEIMSKYYKMDDEDIGLYVLENQAKDLLDYYLKHVTPEFENYIKNMTMANMIPTTDFRIFLRSNHRKDHVEVVESIGAPTVILYNSVRVLRVSNLKLGISHMEKSHKNILCVDWSMYEKYEEVLKCELGKGHFKHMAILWEEDMKDEFRRHFESSEGKSFQKRLKPYLSFVTLIIPKAFAISEKVAITKNPEAVNYVWRDLSAKTKIWALGRKVSFQGRDLTLAELLESVSGEGNVENVMDTALDADALSVLIEQEKVLIGSRLECKLEERRKELIRNHPQIFIPRRTRVRPVELNKETFEWRKCDAFFILTGDESHLNGAGFGEVRAWDGETVPDGTRCFLLGGEWNQRNEDAPFKGITERLEGFPCPGANGGETWLFAHFFKFEGNKYVHLHSEELHTKRAYIIADVPGSGKSVLVNASALERKRQFPMHWVELFELTENEDQIKLWQNVNLTSKECVEDYLFGLVKSREISELKNKELPLQKMILKQFCRSRRNMMVYFDGFDEICPDFRDHVSSLLQALVQNTNVSFVITTRIHECDHLEKHLSTLAHNLVPYNQSEQRKFITSEWNASLQSLSGEERRAKVRNIISGLQSNINMKVEKEISDLVEGLKLLLKKEADSITQDINFTHLAEEMMKLGESEFEWEGNFSESPLNAWLLASVTFENNFNFRKVLRLSELYKRFVETKIRLYYVEKAMALVNDDTVWMWNNFKRVAVGVMKKFAASIFLEDDEYKINRKEIQLIQRIGMAAFRGESTELVHGTFGEYLFAVWLIEKANKPKVTNIWLSKVLLEEKFVNVRNFINSVLLLEYEKKTKSSDGDEYDGGLQKKSLLAPSDGLNANEFVQSMRKCLFASVLDCNEGIFRYLMESSEKHLAELIFEKAAIDMESLGAKIGDSCTTLDWNSFTFCGGCIRGDVQMKKSRVTQSETEYFKFPLELLKFVERHDLTGNLHRFVSEEGFWWMGVNEDRLWMEEEGKVQFKFFFEFLVKHKNVLGEEVKRVMMKEENRNLFVNSAKHASDLFVYILDYIVENDDFKKILKEQKISVSD